MAQLFFSTTVLIDEHDPIVPAWMFDEADWSNTTTLRRTKYGGHVGYLHRVPMLEPGNSTSLGRMKMQRWADPWIACELLK